MSGLETFTLKHSHPNKRKDLTNYSICIFYVSWIESQKEIKMENAPTGIQSLLDDLKKKIKGLRIHNEKKEPYYGEISLSIQSGRLAYIKRTETIK